MTDDGAPISGAKETLFFPLFGRAKAASLWPDVFPDPWALQVEQIAAAEGTAAQDMGRFPAMIYGLRHRITLVEIRRYLADHPGAAVVNIGCGLDRFRPELDPELGDPQSAASATVYNLDFPEVLELRRRRLPPSPGEVDLPYSVTDHCWIGEVDASRGVIAVAAGVFYYLEVADVRALMRAMAEQFPGGRLAYDSEAPWMIRGSEKQIERSGVSASMPFKLKDPRIVATWSDRISSVRVEGDFSSYLPSHLRRRLPLPVRIGFRLVRALRVNAMYEVVVDFAAER